MRSFRSRSLELKVLCDERSERGGAQDKQARLGINAARRHLEHAEAARRRLRYTTARDALARAEEALALSLPEEGVRAKAAEILSAAEAWPASKAATLRKSLAGLDDVPLSVRRERMRHAMRFRNMVESRARHTQAHKGRFLRAFSISSVLLMIVLLVAAAVGTLDFTGVDEKQGSFLVLVIVCGLFSGLASSSSLALSLDRLKGRDVRWNGPWLLLRPLSSAGWGVLVTLLWSAGLFDIPEVERTRNAYLGVAAVAGFSDDVLARAMKAAASHLPFGAALPRDADTTPNGLSR